MRLAAKTRRPNKQGSRLPCFYYSQVTSTNTVAKNLAKSGAIGERAYVLAAGQSAGRGRFNRRFVCKRGKGVYLTYVRRIPQNADAAAAGGFCALAVCRMLAELYGLESRIKWPNDVVVSGGKICGILPESIVGADGRRYLLLGVGVNIANRAGDFGEYAAVAASAGTEYAAQGRPAGEIKRLKRGVKQAAAFLADELDVVAERAIRGDELLRGEYRDKCVTLGRRIGFGDAGGERRAGTAIDIADDCSLIVRDDGGFIHKIAWGEITLLEQ